MSEAPPNRWVRHTVALCARSVLATLAGLLVWTVLPVLIGWQPAVVLSGSMEPAIRTGDVVVTREVPASRLRPGQVLLADAPGEEDSRLLHRFDSTDDDGAIVLQGDANAAPDTMPVTADAVHGVGVLRVPWVGLPYAWTVQGRYLPLALSVLVLGACLVLGRVRELDGRRRAPAHAARRRTWGPLAAAALLAAAVPATGSADAAFSSSVVFPVTFTAQAPAAP
ncbi:signal peptidase, endoplasmic reticulum-type [Georgenia satyanarayanai]|uniref:Signal peptidase I n=1 Tax=Georgenia satyanarayanai TaxID=860221 RepID=A0A2Y9AM25_9MICO|nr:signal peptidase I [Georgenia satyanarayanai]PYF97781.1 signal peptidase [Georgenia satyanarayanai]SSA45521.1 signal peptidase, endoplasmic reticulum-type [Georgenia satyanarayanai]